VAKGGAAHGVKSSGRGSNRSWSPRWWLQLYEGREPRHHHQGRIGRVYGADITAGYGKLHGRQRVVETADKLPPGEPSLPAIPVALARREHGHWIGGRLASTTALGREAPGPLFAFVVQLGGVVADAVAPPAPPSPNCEDPPALLTSRHFAHTGGRWGSG
jgi:hypothetical protein